MDVAASDPERDGAGAHRTRAAGSRARPGEAHLPDSRMRRTSASDGRTLSPATYSHWLMTATPRAASRLVVPTQAPMVDW